MKEIPLTRGQVAIVDDEDYELVSIHSWYAWWHKKMRSFYACRADGDRMVLMHRYILGALPEQEIDHRDHRTLNNQRENIRLCLHAENQWNKGKRRDNTSGIIGVYWSPQSEKWRAEIEAKGKRIHLGLFTDKIDAASARDEAVKRLHGDFGVVNLPLILP